MLSQDGQVRLDWIEPPRGTVRILRTTAPLPYRPGTRLEPGPGRAARRQTGSSRPARTAPWTLDPPPAGPLLLHAAPGRGGRTLTVGHSAVLGWLADPSDLRATRTAPAGDDSRRPVGSSSAGDWAEGGDARPGWSPARDRRQAARRPAGHRDDRRPRGIRSPGLLDDEPCPAPRSTSRAIRASARRRAVQMAAAVPACRATAGTSRPTAWPIARVLSVVSPGLEPTATTAVPGPHPEVTVSYALEAALVPGPALDADPAHRARPARPFLPWSWSPTTGRFPCRPTTARSSPAARRTRRRHPSAIQTRSTSSRAGSAPSSTRPPNPRLLAPVPLASSRSRTDPGLSWHVQDQVAWTESYQPIRVQGTCAECRTTREVDAKVLWLSDVCVVDREIWRLDSFRLAGRVLVG